MQFSGVNFEEESPGELTVLLMNVIKQTDWSAEQKPLLQQLVADFQQKREDLATEHGTSFAELAASTAAMNRFLRVAKAQMPILILEWLLRIEDLMTPEQLAKAEATLKAVTLGRKRRKPQGH